MWHRCGLKRGGAWLSRGARRAGCGLVLLSACLIVMGCMAESPSERVGNTAGSNNHRPVIREAGIVPTPLVLSAPLYVQIDAEDSDRDALVFHYQWFVNGLAVAGQTAATLPTTLLKQGDMVSVEIIPDDGKERGGVYHTARALVINTPPIISSLDVRLSQTDPADKLEAYVEVSDPDHDRIRLTYRWWKNNVVMKEGEDPFLELDGFAPEDIVVVEATPRDQVSAGRPMKSSPLPVGNRPPVIISSPPSVGLGDRYEYSVKAMDPEGDPLRFRLEVAPPGMVIGTETGQISWQGANRLKGAYKVRIVAEDSHGGTAFQEFEVMLAGSIPSPPGGAQVSVVQE